MQENASNASNRLFKYFSLVALVIQYTILIILIRYTRICEANLRADISGREAASNGTGQATDLREIGYLSSTVVFFSETVKLVTCCAIVFVQKSCVFRNFWSTVQKNTIESPIEMFKMIIPAFLFTFQNNLSFFALTYLDAATFQVLSQLKILTTAFISVLILRTKLNAIKWLSLFLLVLGVSIIELQKSFAVSTKPNPNRMIGLVSVIVICLMSGFSTVYFEKLLKRSSISIWMRNIQLSFFGMIFGCANIYILDADMVRAYGMFKGYSSLVFLIVLFSAMGGLLIAAVITYADNIIKGFATSLSIISSSLISFYVLDDLALTTYFIVGASIIMFATFIYGYKTQAKSNQAPLDSNSVSKM